MPKTVRRSGRNGEKLDAYLRLRALQGRGVEAWVARLDEPPTILEEPFVKSDLRIREKD